MLARRCLIGLAVAATLVAAAIPARADEVSDIQQRGTFRVGMAESPPWQSPNPDTGKYEGFNVDLANRVAKIMGVKLEIVPATWSTLIAGLQAKQYDAVFANLFATPERALVVDFTDPYASYGFNVVVNANSKFHTMADLNAPEVTFVGQSGTVEEAFPKQVFPKAKVRGLVGGDVASWIGEVASGQADAAFLDPGTYTILKTRNPNLEQALRIVNPGAPIKPVALAYAVRTDAPHLLAFLNTFVRDFTRQGESDALRDKWFQILAGRK